MTPEDVLTWWDVIDRIGLLGFILGQIVFIGWLLKKYTPVFLNHWARHVKVMEDINEALQGKDGDDA